jgi:hypothetical protein
VRWIKEVPSFPSQQVLANERKSHWVKQMIPGDGKRLWSLYIVNISLDPFHNLIWLEYGFLCVLLKTIYSMPLPFHLFNYFLEVLDFASLASGTEKEVFISSVSVQDYVQRA